MRPVAVTLGLLLVLVGGGSVVLNAVKDDDPKISYPKKWDSRILPYVKIVEKERGLTFKHPVKVKFLSAKEFEKTVRSDKKDLDKDEKKEIEQTTALFRAFGLIDGSVDLFDAFNDAQGSGTLAYYSFKDKAVTVRGSKLTLAVRATLVHELTHVLQDQRFDVGDRLTALRKKAEKGTPTTAADALDAIVEGDAERTAELYRASLSSKQRAALEKAENADQKDASSKLDKLPGVVVTLLSAPYALGQALTEAVASEDKKDVDDLLRDPPTDDSVLLDPLTAIGGTQKAQSVAIPKVPGGNKKFDSGQMGALITYLILAQRIPLRDALAAADGWDGDAYVAYDTELGACAEVEYATDSTEAGTRLRKAFTRWVLAAPGEPGSIGGKGDRVSFTSCDPGKKVKVAKDAASDALQLVATRGYLGVGIMKAGVPAKGAQCVAQGMVQRYSLANLNDPTFGANDKTVIAKIRELSQACAKQLG